MSEETFYLKVQKLSQDAVLPKHAKQGDVGFDCVALDDGVWNYDLTYIEYSIGIAIEVPPGYHVELFPRSSISNYDLVLANSVGLVDHGFHGNLRFRFKYIPRLGVNDETIPSYESSNYGYESTTKTIQVKYEHDPILYKKGDKIGQIVIRKTYDFPVFEVEELTKTQRGTGGFGSSDTK